MPLVRIVPPMRSVLSVLMVAVLLAWVPPGPSLAAPPVLHRFTIPQPVAELGSGSVALPFEMEFTAPNELALFVINFLSPDGYVFEHPFLLRSWENSVTGSRKAGISAKTSGGSLDRPTISSSTRQVIPRRVDSNPGNSIPGCGAGRSSHEEFQVFRGRRSIGP